MQQSFSQLVGDYLAILMNALADLVTDLPIFFAVLAAFSMYYITAVLFINKDEGRTA